MRRTTRATAMILATVLLFTAPALADAPMLLNYQGHLTDPGGTPKNGTFSMQFSVYDAATGGNQLPTAAPWTETQNVTVTDGVFNVLLGSMTALPTDLFKGGPSESAGPSRYLQVVVEAEALAPRRRIVSAAYSLQLAASAGVGSCVPRSSTAPGGTYQSSVTCLAGEAVSGGGCSLAGGTVYTSEPTGNGWDCAGFGGGSNGMRATAICCP